MRLALILVIALACLAASGSWRIYSPTWDEPEHLAAGIQLLDRGLYEYDTEHPPLGRVLLATGPYLAGARSFGTLPPDGTAEGKDILYSQDPGHYLVLARAGVLPFLALLLFSTWLWARHVLHPAAAVAAVAILASVPAVLGNAGLATLDIAAAATTLLALYTLEQWLQTGRPRDALLFGLAAGVAVGTKYSAVPFIALALPTLAALHLFTPRRPGTAGVTAGAWLAGLALSGCAALVMVFLIFAPRALDPAGVAERYDWAIGYLRYLGGPNRALGVLLAHLWLPREFKDLVNGIVSVKAHNDSGHHSYLLGHISLDGWWYFYLVVLAVKTPLPLLIAGPAGLGWMARDGRRRRDGWSMAPAVIVATLLAFASMYSHINIGIRHILILYPFLAIGATWTLVRTWEWIARWQARGAARMAVGVLGAALLWQLSTVWRAYPDYLPYFNETVSDPQSIVVDSDLDWGQDLGRLEQRTAELHIPQLWLAYSGTFDPRREPLPPVQVLKPRQPVTGWVAISALQRASDPRNYAWLNAYEPVERIGKTIDLYYIP